jgi:hypothetical protein
MTLKDGNLLYQWLLATELTADDDRRFYASYLLGHVSLAIAETEDNPASFSSLLQQSLASALATDKLSDNDRNGILALLEEGKVSA